MAEHANIHEAKAAIMAEVPYIRKVKGTDLPYSYATERDFIRRVRPAMVSHGVTSAPIGCRVVDSSTIATKRGGTLILRCIEATYRFTHTASQTFEDVAVVASGCDVMDKASSKAMTQAFKYALRQWLVIETGDDPESLAEIDGLHLSPAASKAREAIVSAKTRADLDSVEKRIAGSSNMSAPEKAWLTEPLQQKRDELTSLDDMNGGANAE